eukprot:5587794-Prymnesium_polylepis.1
MSGERSPKPTTRPPGGKYLVLWSVWCFGMGFGGFSRLFTLGPVALGFFELFFCFSGFLWLLSSQATFSCGRPSVASTAGMLPRRTGESRPRRAGLHAQPDDQDAASTTPSTSAVLGRPGGARRL